MNILFTPVCVLVNIRLQKEILKEMLFYTLSSRLMNLLCLFQFPPMLSSALPGSMASLHRLGAPAMTPPVRRQSRRAADRQLWPFSHSPSPFSWSLKLDAQHHAPRLPASPSWGSVPWSWEFSWRQGFFRLFSQMHHF